MILAETIRCTSTVQPQSYAELIPIWATNVVCDLPTQGFDLEFGVQVAAAIGTVGALFVSIFLAYQAKKEPSRLEFLGRELDRYEELKLQFTEIPHWLIDEPESMTWRIRPVFNAATSWRVYARTRHPKLADSWFTSLNVLQGTAQTFATVNTGGIPRVIGYEDAQDAFSKWVSDNPKFESILNEDIHDLLDQMAAFYAGAATPRAALAKATELESTLVEKYRVQAEYFKKRTEHNRKPQ